MWNFLSRPDWPQTRDLFASGLLGLQVDFTVAQGGLELTIAHASLELAKNSALTSPVLRTDRSHHA